MAEQSTAAMQVTSAVESMRKQSEQAARALSEQSRALKALTGASQNTSKQIKLISRANVEHSTSAERTLSLLKDARTIAERNARGVKETRGGTTDLLRQAESLVNGLQAGSLRAASKRPAGQNGRANGRATTRGRTGSNRRK